MEKKLRWVSRPRKEVIWVLPFSRLCMTRVEVEEMWSSEAIFLFTPLLFLGIEGVTELTPQASPYQNLPTKICCLCEQVILLIKPSLPPQGWASQRENLVIRYFSNQMVSGSLLALAALLTHCLRYSCLAVKRHCVQGDLPKKHLIGGLSTAWEVSPWAVWLEAWWQADGQSTEL